ncbi:MAG TPA: hypothetical protein DC057_19650 [Spirochaetia bacterium]|nr:hypothetical protein [Spirochaetia bacterium]
MEITKLVEALAMVNGQIGFAGNKPIYCYQRNIKNEFDDKTVYELLDICEHVKDGEKYFVFNKIYVYNKQNFEYFLKRNNGTHLNEEYEITINLKVLLNF